MKKLLVLTDFSTNAFHAEAAALKLSVKLGTGIMLYHTLPYIPLIPSDSGGPYINETAKVLFEDSKERLTQEADRLREVATMTLESQVDIEENNGEGSLKDVIDELTRSPEIQMVIMGGQAGGAIDHLLTGSDTAAVIRKACKPVWIIPEAADWNIPQKVLLATNYEAADMPVVDFLLDMAETLGFKLEVVHVLRNNETVAEIESEVAFRKFLGHRALTCNQVFGESVQQSLQQYCKDNRVDLLAMTHGHHSFISRIFGHSESKAAIKQRHLGMLVFPPDFK